MTAPVDQRTTLAGYACNDCGRLIFTADQLLDTRPLWDLGEYDGESYLIGDVADWSQLRRYDTSLHEGWYCCRFIVMRMTHDKFGTGDALLVYTDSVHPVELGQDAAPAPQPRGAIVLSGDEFDPVLASPQLAGTLAVVKLGAIWCPPCRLMDKVITGIEQAGGIEGVQFFEVDIDHNLEFADRFPCQTIPYTMFYRDGRRIPVRGDRLHLVEGGIIGGIGTHDLTRIVTTVRDQVDAGAQEVVV